MPPVRCMDCMDAGYRMYDGTPSPCPSCDAGAAFEQEQRTGGRAVASLPRSDMIPRMLPPGGDVMVTEMKRQAAGLPVGVIGSDVLVRAQVEAQPLVHELVRLLDDFTRDTPGTLERAVEAMGVLPTWAIPDDVRDREPMAAVPEPLPLSPDQPPLPVAPAAPVDKEARTPRRPSKAPPAAPLEPPPD